MNVYRTPFRSRSGEGLRAVAERLPRRERESDLPPFQMRTCARCGRHTTFQLQDLAGWYSCAQCGRFA
jgi:hypothetical protein